CLEGETPQSVRSLQAQEGDQLLGLVLQAVEEEREALQVELIEGPEEWRIRGKGIDLRLHPWTFGERNEALRRSLRLTDGQISLDLPAYEMQMVQTCVTTEDGERLAQETVATWPLALGEMVTQALDRINGLEEQHGEILEACVREGRDHPDLSLLYLCRHFGWRPEQVERMDARLAERLLAALRVVEQGRLQAAAALQGEEVSRIIVDDD
ncbi:MAG: hypothetical protein ACOY94_17590, partial [Bacillota bacterium]